MKNIVDRYRLSIYYIKSRWRWSGGRVFLRTYFVGKIRIAYMYIYPQQSGSPKIHVYILDQASGMVKFKTKAKAQEYILSQIL